MGFNLRGDKNSLALLSSKRVKAYSRTKADEAFALPSFSDAMPAPRTELPPQTSNTVVKPERHVERPYLVERDSENVKQTMLQHESVFKEQLHELHRLYQKQCILMVESQTGNSCHPCPEPPSSNSSLSCNPDTFNPLVEDGRLGDTRPNRAFDNHGNLCTFPTQMADIKPCIADTYQHQQQDRARPLLDLERPAERRPIFDLERRPDDAPTFHLERPAEEYLDVELGKEKARAMGLSHTSVQASVLSHSDCIKENADIIITGENKDFVSRNKRDIWGRTMTDFCSGYNRGKAQNICKDEVNIKERMCEGYFPPGRFENHISDPREDCWASSHLSNKSLPIPCQGTFPYPVDTSSASRPFRGLPDMNGELGLTENQMSPVQRKPEKIMNGCNYIDLEANPSVPNKSSKLPHWLLQPPPTSSKGAAPAKFLPQTSEWQQQKTPLFSSQVHDISRSVGVCNSIPGTLMNASTFHEPYHTWSHSNANSQEVFYKQPSSSLPFFSAGDSKPLQEYLHGAHFNRVSDGSIPSFLPCPTYSGKIGLSTAPRMPSSHCVDRQDIVFDTQAASKELLSSISSRETMTLPPAVLPWYQQKESFSSLMHQASNPEPPFQRESPLTSVNQWGAAAIHQALPRSIVDNTENVAYGMHSVGRNFEGPCLVAAKPESPPRKEHGFDFLSSNEERNAANPWKQVEKPFYVAQNTEETTLRSSDYSRPTLSRNAFDLNVSSDASMEDKFDFCHFTQSRCGNNQNKALKEEFDMINDSGCDMSKVNKALCINEQLQGTGCADRVAEKGLGCSEVLIKEASQSLFNSAFPTKPGMGCFPQERLGGHNTCADNCSGDDEPGAGFVEVKSSDASGLTSCESRDAAHLELAKARDYSNTSSGEACQSRESRIPACHKEEAFSLNVQSRSGGLPAVTANESQQWGSCLFSRTQNAPRAADMKGDCLGIVCTDESEAANHSSITRKHSSEATEIAQLLLSLSCELLPTSEVQKEAINHEEKSLDWLANIIPQEENCEEEQGLDVDMAGLAMLEGKISSMVDGDEKAMDPDPFEVAVLELKPINPDVERLTSQAVERGSSLAENGPSLPTLRRRSSRRGRAVKDFQREILGCMTSLSRHEVTEDLQFIEGLIKSTTEEMNVRSFFEEEEEEDESSKPPSSPESGSMKKARGNTKAFKGERKPNGAWNVGSWGESTRRKRMVRQRSQRSYLPPCVQSSPLDNNAGDGALAFVNVVI